LTDSTVPEINNLSEKPDMDKIISHLDHSAKAEVKPQEHKIGDDMPKEPVENVLPRLTGIIKVSGSGNQPEFIALMEGKQLNKNDKIMDFTVINITSDGVSLAGKGENRFIPTPKIFFSVSK